jgi:hypothetical protein
MNLATSISSRRIILTMLAFTLLVITNPGCTNTKSADQKSVAQRTFATPEDALSAVVHAMRDNDSQELTAIFGPDSDDLLFSGDPVDDQQTLDRFLTAYDEKHTLVPSDDKNSMTIVVGHDDWPMPIPIVKDKSGKWLFDTANGKDEVITRRIGRNELTVIEVCQAICDAQRDYAHLDPNGDGIPEYARKFISDPGQKNGLYWPTTEGEKESPLGEAVAQAQGEGYTTAEHSSASLRPYHGYLYRILTAQGKDAPGGAMDYIMNGKFIGGFAIVAWPVDYGSSGIMTFMANYKGEVIQKDLGEATDKLAREMKDYNPDASWKKAE